MLNTRLLLLVALTIAAPALATDAQCTSEYERGKREIGAYAEIIGVIEGTIYAHSLIHDSPKVCLSGSPREKIQAIGKALSSSSFRDEPIVMTEFIPTREQAIKFLVRFFPCE